MNLDILKRKEWMKLLIFVSVFIPFHKVFSQQNLPSEKVQSLLKIAAQYEGKYEVQIRTREKADIQLIVYEKMKKLQSNTDTVYFPLKENIRIMIPPKNVTESKNFILMEKFKYMDF